MAKKQMDGKKAVSSSLKTARLAAIECVKAVQQVNIAAQAATDGKRPQDLHPLLARLYKALRDGWEPICRCWPELAERDEAMNARKDLAPREPVPPVEAWLTAKTLFWTALAHGDRLCSALDAWEKWVWEYKYVVAEEIDSDADAWKAIQRFFASYSPEVWETLRTAIKGSKPTAEVDTRAAVPSNPGVPARPKPLPKNKVQLERLLDRLDKFIDDHEGELTKLAADNKRQLSGHGALAGLGLPSCPFMRGFLPPPVRELAGYASPVELACRIQAVQSVISKLDDLLAPGCPTSKPSAVSRRELAGVRKGYAAAADQLLGLFREVRERVLTELSQSRYGGRVEGRSPTRTEGSPGTQPTTTGAQPWSHDVAENPPPEFSYGPVTGQKKELAAACWLRGADGRTLEKACRDGTFWARRSHRRCFELWFKTEKRFLEVREKLVGLESP